MDTDIHTLSGLFDQLGLPSSQQEIEAFLVAHKPLPDDIYLASAPFWNSSQRAFIAEAITNDSDWAEQVDQLDALLRS
ncbi:MAG: DUF2789 domain-containing protein [Gammaproteobacteria bacterium]|nr:MAG: DUF2789 domain-containing protein [Gammaproteobacteria bacterium]